MKRTRDDETAARKTRVALHVLVTKQQLGAIIGKSGANIKHIRCHAKAALNIAEPQHDAQPRTVAIEGDREHVELAARMLLESIGQRAAEAIAAKAAATAQAAATASADAAAAPEQTPPPVPPPAAPPKHALMLAISNAQAGGIIGRGGAGIAAIRESSGASLRVDPNRGPNAERVLQLSGSLDALISATQTIIARLIEVGVDLGSSRKRAGAYGGAHHHAGPPPPHAVPTGVAGGAYRGYDARNAYGNGAHGPFPQQPQYANYQPHPHAPPLPPHPGVAQGGHAHAARPPGVVFGGPGGEGVVFGGPGAHFARAAPPPGLPPPVPPSAGAGAGGATAEQLVPGHLVGLILGKGGQTVRQIREQSGAKIHVAQPGPDSTFRRVQAIGEPAAVQHALALINEKLALAGGHQNR